MVLQEEVGSVYWLQSEGVEVIKAASVVMQLPVTAG